MKDRRGGYGVVMTVCCASRAHELPKGHFMIFLLVLPSLYNTIFRSLRMQLAVSRKGGEKKLGRSASSGISAGRHA